MTNYSITRGDTQTFTLTLSNLSSSGLTGFSFWFTAKNNIDDLDAAAVIQKLTAAFTVVTVGSATIPGVATFTILPTDTASLTDYTVLEFDIQVKDASGNIFTPVRGSLTVNADVTRATI